MWRALIAFLGQILKNFSFKYRIENKMDSLVRRVIRLEILDAIKRKDTKTVCALFDEYTALGGNSYTALLVEDYKKPKKRKTKHTHE